jgi:hypothetical protein
VLVAAVIWTAIRWNAPPLSILRDGSDVVVGMGSLGEYPTTVARMRLSEMNSGKVVWEVRSENSTTQLHGFRLSAGQNPTDIGTYHGRYHVAVPERSGSFELRSGVKYRLEAWGGKTIASRSIEVFEVGDPQ